MPGTTMRHTPPALLHELVFQRTLENGEDAALNVRQSSFSYAELWEQVRRFSTALQALELQPAERVAIYLPKTPEAVIAMFGATHAGGVFVPVNPLLKPAQVAYILQDCNVRVLVTSPDRLKLLDEALGACRDLHTVIVTGNEAPASQHPGIEVYDWEGRLQASPAESPVFRIDTDMAAIIYTSGSTGRPKGVVLSHRNMVVAAQSTVEFLHLTREDNLLVILPLSFDYGLNQVTAAFAAGATATLLDYLVPKDVIRTIARKGITGVSAVPPIWTQLARLDWPPEAVDSLRYLTSSGGALPVSITRTLQKRLPKTDIYLMYGLTEAFRSTFLPPEQVDIRPESVGKAVPYAEVMVVREDGSECAPGEPGELVHRGSLVAMGYWNDPERTAERFRPAPGQEKGLPIPEIAVWSGDRMKKDEEGYLYFVSRNDEMIKTSGYRVSPSEVEEVVYATGMVKEAAAIGVPHPDLGQGILLVAVADGIDDPAPLLSYCRKVLPTFMVPHDVVFLQELPHNPNGKIDRRQLAGDYRDHFAPDDTPSR